MKTLQSLHDCDTSLIAGDLNGTQNETCHKNNVTEVAVFLTGPPSHNAARP